MSIRWLSAFLAFCMVIATTGPACAQEDSFPILPSVYRIRASGCKYKPRDRILTGFRVQGITGIVTALHGVIDCTSITATGADGDPIKELQITQVDLDHDLALMYSKQLQATSLPAALPVRPLKKEPLRKKEALTIVGYPYTMISQDAREGNYIQYTTLEKVTEGTGAYEGLNKRGSPSLTVYVLKLDGVHLLPGHSGAPVLDEQRRLVGIGNGGIRQDVDGLSWASWAMLWSDVKLSSVEGKVKKELEALKGKDPAAALSFSSTFPGETPSGSKDSIAKFIAVRDSETDKPLTGAEVTLVLADRYEIGRTQSRNGQDATVKFILQPDDELQFLFAQAVGYEVFDEPLGTISDLPASIDLRPRCMFSVTVVDHRSEPVAKAMVTITYGGRIKQCGRTDSEGFSTCLFPCTQHAPTINVDVSADGYKPYKKNAYSLSGGELRVSLRPEETPTPTPTRTPTFTPTSTSTPTPSATPPPEPPTVWNFRLEGSQAALYYVDLDTGSFAADFQPSGAADILLDGGITSSWLIAPPPGNSARIAQTGQQIGSKEACASQSLSDSLIPLGSTDLITGVWFCARTNEGRIAEFWLQKLNIPNTFAFTIRLWP